MSYHTPLKASGLIAVAALLVAQAIAVEEPKPVGANNETATTDYAATGLIEAAYAWGSGVVVEHPRVVLSCAHVVYDNFYQQWTSGAKWYRAYNSVGRPDVQSAQALNGYFFWRSYAAAAQATAIVSSYINSYPLEYPIPDRLYGAYFRAAANEFNQDAVAYFSYSQDLYPGVPPSMRKDGAARLATADKKWVTGYPGGRYPENDPLEYQLHKTGPFYVSLTPEFRRLANYVTAYDDVETGAGNSGGPVWVEDNNNVPSVAGILVSGAEMQTEGESFIGVHATSALSSKLVEAAKTSAGQTSRTSVYEVMSSGDIPDAQRTRVPGGKKTIEGQLTRVFRVSGMPKTINEIRVDLDIDHAERKDLVIMLQTPARRRLPIYDGSYEDPGENIKVNDLEAPLFYGLNPNGIWVLRVIDTAPSDSGKFVSAKIHITAR